MSFEGISGKFSGAEDLNGTRNTLHFHVSRLINGMSLSLLINNGFGCAWPGDMTIFKIYI